VDGTDADGYRDKHGCSLAILGERTLLVVTRTAKLDLSAAGKLIPNSSMRTTSAYMSQTTTIAIG
jgi:hypothetical protein